MTHDRVGAQSTARRRRLAGVHGVTRPTMHVSL